MLAPATAAIGADTARIGMSATQKIHAQRATRVAKRMDGLKGELGIGVCSGNKDGNRIRLSCRITADALLADR